MDHSTDTSFAPSPALRAWAWAPLACIALLVAWSVLGAQGPSPASADASTVQVTGSIDSEVHIVPTACAASALNIGDLVPGDPWKTVQDNGGTACALSFGTLNTYAGANLTVLEDPTSSPLADPAMKCVGGGCGSDSIADRDGTRPVAGQSGFGMQLLSAGSGTTPVWPTDGTVKDVQDSGDVACSTSGTTDGSCTFTFGASTTVDAPGAYQANVQALVLAR